PPQAVSGLRSGGGALAVESWQRQPAAAGRVEKMISNPEKCRPDGGPEWALGGERKFCCVAHDGLKFLSSRDPPTSTSQGAEISGMSHWVPLCYPILRPCRNQDMLWV
ncbi:hypothetical protein EGK_02538, partial [Macaca mulatta]